MFTDDKSDFYRKKNPLLRKDLNKKYKQKVENHQLLEKKKRHSPPLHLASDNIFINTFYSAPNF